MHIEEIWKSDDVKRNPIQMLGEAQSNPAHRNPWEVHSESGLEGVFADEDDARFYAEEIRGSGARGVAVERRMRKLVPRQAMLQTNPAYVGFHGSTRPIKDPSTMPINQGDFGVGMYFSTSEVDAGRYGFDTYRSSLHLDHPFVAPAEITPELDRIRLAFGINEEDATDVDEGAWHGLVGLLNSMIEVGLLGKKAFVATMRKLGYDGIVVPNDVVRLSHGNRRAKGDYIVIFDFASIKSWDPAFATLDEWKTAYRASQNPPDPKEWQERLEREDRERRERMGRTGPTPEQLYEEYNSDLAAGVFHGEKRGRARDFRNPSPALGDKYILGTYGPGSRVQLGEWTFPSWQPSGFMQPGDWVTVVYNHADANGVVGVKPDRTGGVLERDGRHPLVEVDPVRSVRQHAKRNPIEMHANPGPRVLREKWGDSSDIVIESNRFGYTGWLESRRGGGRRPISFGGTTPTNAREAMELAKKFLRGVHGRTNPGRKR
jgi:hypothetical protein